MSEQTSAPVDHLARIVERKRGEVARREARAEHFARFASQAPAPASRASDALRRAAGGPRVIAEIKLRSPSAGTIRDRAPGELPRIARGYEAGGASAVSVLCDGPGFGGCPLDLRRVAEQVRIPVLFKEFVLSPVQVHAARAVGASMVLLLVRVLEDGQLADLIDAVHAAGLEPVVEAADGEELDRALATSARIVGVNARNLRSFQVNAHAATELVDRIPEDRVAVFMSGIRSREDYSRLMDCRADACLVGEGLMRASDPGARLQEWLSPG